MKFEAVLFDCDGVLVDSEPITLGVLRDMLIELGWNLSMQECVQHFLGITLRQERALIEARTGRAMSEDWLAQFYQRRNQALEERLEIIVGADLAVTAAQQHSAGRIACASGADRFKIEMQLTKVGLLPYFEGRIFSGHEVPRSKPAPDVYLAAAQHLQAAAQRCLVIEDTVTGVSAGVAAGATVWGYCPERENADALIAAGASDLFASMGELARRLSGAVGLSGLR